MKKMIAPFALLLSLACQAQGPNPSLGSLTVYDFLINAGYAYFNAGHLTCDIVREGVEFVSEESGSSIYKVTLSYKDMFDQRCFCSYLIRWSGSLFTGLSWNCNSPDYKCFAFCNDARETYISELKKYQRQHPSQGDNDQLREKIEQIIQKQFEQITCQEFVEAFLTLDYNSR